jgi:hypothetical protein
MMAMSPTKRTITCHYWGMACECNKHCSGWLNNMACMMIWNFPAHVAAVDHYKSAEVYHDEIWLRRGGSGLH